MSKSLPEEVEAKFTILDPNQALFLRQTPDLTAQFALQPANAVTHVDTYLDTAAYHLLRHGYTVRIRHTPTGYLVTVKSLPLATRSHLHRRLELEAPLAATHNLLATEHWPATIRHFVTDQLGDDTYLQPICTLQQTRWKRLVTPMDKRSDKAAPPFAELSIDEVQVYDPAGWTQQSHGEAAWPLLTSFQEVEAELLANQDEALLERLTQKLGRLRGIRPSHQSKLERGLALASLYTRQGEQALAHIQPTMHMADACRLIWRQQMTQLLLNEAGVRYGNDSEYVHDMRVAIRRARVALRLFGRYFRRKSIRNFGEILQITGRKLGAVRDRDVAVEKLAKQQKHDSPNETDFSSISHQLTDQREQVFAELVTWLDSPAYTDFVSEFTDFCHTPAKGVRHFQQKEDKAPIPYQVRHVAPGLLMERFSRVRAFELHLEQPELASPTTLHQLRIQCKFFRYHLEFVQHLLGPAGSRLIQTLKQLQEHLGELNDAAVAQQLLTEMRDHVDETAATAYQTIQANNVTALHRQVTAHLADFLSPANRRRLAQAITRL